MLEERNVDRRRNGRRKSHVTVVTENIVKVMRDELRTRAVAAMQFTPVFNLVKIERENTRDGSISAEEAGT